MTTTVRINGFDYAILNVGYGSRFIRSNDSKPLFQDCDVDDVELLAIYSHDYHYHAERRTSTKEVMNSIYNESEMDSVFRVVGEETFNDQYGTIVIKAKDRKLSWTDISIIVDHLERLDLCAHLNMSNMTDLTFHKNESTSVCEIDFDTESG